MGSSEIKNRAMAAISFEGAAADPLPVLNQHGVLSITRVNVGLYRIAPEVPLVYDIAGGFVDSYCRVTWNSAFAGVPVFFVIPIILDTTDPNPGEILVNTLDLVGVPQDSVGTLFALSVYRYP